MDIESEENSNPDTIIPFQSMKALPVLFFKSQCVAYKDEILICGGYFVNDCYSYHTIKDEYIRICAYPKNVELSGHCVVKIGNQDDKNANAITLLCFGGYKAKQKYALVMKYVSVWEKVGSKRARDSNTWKIFKDKSDHPISIGKEAVDYKEVRAVVGGSSNHLLFITYPPKNIDVFDLNNLQFQGRCILPTYTNIESHCLVLKSNGNADKKKKSEMVLFCKDTGLSIEYNEEGKKFQFEKFRAYSKLRSCHHFAYVCINNEILFFGGYSGNVSNRVHKYSIHDDVWMTYEHTLPVALQGSAAVLNVDNTCIYLLGGKNNQWINLKIKAEELMKKQTKQEEQWAVEEQERREIEIIRMEWNRMKDAFDIKKLKVIRQTEIEIIIAQWYRSLFVKLRWVDELNKIVSRYVMQYKYIGQLKYFKLLRELPVHHSYINSVRFSPDGSRILSSSKDQTVRIWDTRSGHEIFVFRGHSNAVNDAQFSPDGSLVISCSKDKTVQKTGKVVNCAQISPNGKLVLCTSRKVIRLLDAKSGVQLKVLTGHSQFVYYAQFSPDSQTIVSASSDKTVGLWNVSSGERLYQLIGHSDAVVKARFSPDGLFVVSCSSDQTIRIWDTISGKMLQVFEGESNLVTDVQYSPDGQTIFLSAGDGTIKLWDVKLGLEIQKLKVRSSAVTGVDISPNGDLLASSFRSGEIQLWVPL
ncbi:G-protein beta WD-40 repeats containing protein [Reticulomyxa filosa]|uniref:G-protein beta WD-40 repeats containing protein n=1 Tax=Reticulomyxa filosa TaxID=46433 RepID=X6M8W4_RETFI|nr:G-protein beta WD-40 repeats containing protein [Reticulomyxa filosa]|eukprot:ETO09892.1 G-protein beta WD-40 repeats containing protein [Reticulomyxa filosa]